MKNWKRESIGRLTEAGINYSDAVTLRRISMTLHRWHEMECGDGNNYGSWCITRGFKLNGHDFTHDDDGAPYLEHHHYMHGHGKDSVSYKLRAFGNAIVPQVAAEFIAATSNTELT